MQREPPPPAIPDAPPDRAICSARRRLVGFLLDGLVLGLTFVVGWYAWSLVRYRALRGPGKQLLGMAVVDRRTGRKPAWRRGLVRGAAKWSLLLPLATPALLALDRLDRAARALDVVPERAVGATTAVAAVALQLALLLVTTCWLLGNPRRQQLWDLLAGTLVVRAPPPQPDRPAAPSP